MMLVIAIIIILASSVIFGVSGYLNSANKAEADINQQSSELVSHIDASESLLEYYGF
jgi:type II secretory pathway pseudopilin PulG